MDYYIYRKETGMINYSALNDEELVELSQNNNQNALSELSLRYSKVSFGIASTFAENSDICDDLSQEGMLGFLSAVYSYENNSKASFLTYASRCIRNRILSALRKSTSTKRIPDSLLISLEQISDTFADRDTPEELFISHNNAKFITALIEELLSNQEKDVLTLFLSGISYSDIAKKLNLSQKAVDSTLQRAKKKLREKLRNNF